ncbi:CHAD domain-containing protein [Streptomyces sp. MST-110588]|uniref:CHAD domain-containing protein n=1 Tax=Streptomyces sp. MST-110588 TaxID=2833628 RepID=UPI001F5C7E13|nr:CHAD domain-containing protein [Streptomyces sp. MST-110588]UNO43915.1 CHAD domain-containing protein [Streptomyces sp. MST-110588]
MTAGTTAAVMADATAGEVLAGYLQRQSTEFLRSLRLHRESGPDADGAGEAVRQLRRAARRISGVLHTYRPLVEESWADHLQSELGWLSATLAREDACGVRLERLMGALQRLTGRGGRTAGSGPAGRTGRGSPAGGASASGTPTTQRPGYVSGSGPAPGPGPVPVPSSVSVPVPVPVSPSGTAPTLQKTEAAPADEALAAGAARAGALLDRQLTLARTRAHSAALQALGSSRFHAVADALAVLASEVPLLPATADRPAGEVLPEAAEQTCRRLTEAVAALPLSRAGHPYNADALAADQRQDVPWHQVRMLVRLNRYAQEVLRPGNVDARLAEASRVLERHRDAAEAAAAAAAAARTPRIAPATAYALGVLHADQRHEVEAARFAFGRLWAARERG